MTSSARIAVLGAALLFSTGGAAIKVAAFSAAQVSALRSGIAALVLLALFRRRLVWTRWTAWSALAYAGTLTLFVIATKLTTSANAIFLQSTAPVYVLALSPWLLHEHVSRRDTGYLVCALAGMAFCILGQPHATITAPDPRLGNLAAVGAGIAWALTLITLRHLNRDGAGTEAPGLAAVIAGNAIASVMALPWAFPFPDATAAEWGTVVYLGVVQIALAYVFLTAAMRRLPALEVSLLLLLEPVLNPVWTWIVHGEVPGAFTVLGGAVIIGVTALRTTFLPPARTLHRGSA